MPKAKQSSKRKKFDYNQNRKKLKKKFLKKCRPTIDDVRIRGAWNNKKSVSKNLKDMGLTFDPNQTLPIRTPSLLGHSPEPKPSNRTITKPYVLARLEEEASRPEKNKKTLSTDLMDYVHHMVRQHKDDYKAMARDEKNYYQDTPKQIKRKINDYQRCHPDLFQAFMDSLDTPPGQ